MRPVQANPTLMRGMLQDIQHMVDVQCDGLLASFSTIQISVGRSEEQNSYIGIYAKPHSDACLVRWIISHQDVVAWQTDIQIRTLEVVDIPEKALVEI